ncbi:MAG: hypothetical protein BWY21_01579 [Parcubacteria group bacterium ADurb.Bin216]|nr:MAG: hypothetical protein BWY21_01579 [Parcubacteria group bacterium ADurb.Bin216]
MPVKILDGTVNHDKSLGLEDSTYIEYQINDFLIKEKAYISMPHFWFFNDGNFCKLMITYEHK